MPTAADLLCLAAEPFSAALAAASASIVAWRSARSAVTSAGVSIVATAGYPIASSCAFSLDVATIVAFTNPGCD